MLGQQLPSEMTFDDFEGALSLMPEGEAWELVDGRVAVSDAGHTYEHNILVQNVAHAMMGQFRAADTSHRTFVCTFYFESRALRSALLPHVMVRSGLLPPGATSCDDPVAIIEVCETGRAAGRDDRWAIYRRLPTLKHHVVVDSAAPSLRVHDRAGAVWREPRLATGLDASLDLAALDLSIPLAEIYRDVLKPAA